MKPPRVGIAKKHYGLSQKVNQSVKAKIFRLNHSSLGSSTTGAVLDNSFKLLQILGIVAGAIWFLKDYSEFKRMNNDLTNKNAELTQSSIILANNLNQLKFERSITGRVGIKSASSAVLSSKYSDGTFLYRFRFGLEVSDISDSNMTIPAVVIEFFLATNPVGDLKYRDTILINRPGSFLIKPLQGDVRWERKFVGVQRFTHVDKQTDKIINAFPEINIGLTGVIKPGETHNLSADFLVRARPEDIVGAVATLWTQDENNAIRRFFERRTEILSESREASLSKEETSPTINSLAPGSK